MAPPLSEEELKAARSLALRNKDLPLKFINIIKNSEYPLCGEDEDGGSICFICLNKIIYEKEIWRQHIRHHLDKLKAFI